MENRVAQLQAELSRLGAVVEQLVARAAVHFPPPPQIALANVTGSTGTLQDWDGSKYVDAGLSDPVTVHPLGAQAILYRPQSQRWEMLTPSTVKWVTFYLPQALNGQLSIANCPIITDWYNNAGATNITVFNELGFTGDAGAEGYAAQVPATGRWVIIQLPCAAGTS
jgi:hypothetical protein